MSELMKKKTKLYIRWCYIWHNWDIASSSAICPMCLCSLAGRQIPANHTRCLMFEMLNLSCQRRNWVFWWRVLSFKDKHMRLSWRCLYRVTPSRQANIRGFGFALIPVTALLVYLFQLTPVIFTYLRILIVLAPSRRFWIWRHLYRLQMFFFVLNESGRVGSCVKNPDPVPSL